MSSNKLCKNQFLRDYSNDRSDIAQYKANLDKAMDALDIATTKIKSIKLRRELQHIKFNISYLKDEEVVL